MASAYRVRWSVAGTPGSGYIESEYGPDDEGGWQGCLPRVLREVVHCLHPSYFPVGLTWIALDLEIRYAGPARDARAADGPEEHTQRRWPRARMIVRRESSLRPPSITFDPGGDPEECEWEEGVEDEEDGNPGP